MRKILLYLSLMLGVIAGAQTTKPTPILSVTIPDHLYSDAPFSIHADTNSTGTVSFAISGVATISGNTITLAGVNGPVTVTSSITADANYSAASSMVTFNVSGGPAGYTTILGTHVGGDANLISNSTIQFTPIAGNGTPISFRAGGNGGPVVTRPITAQVNNGQVAVSVPDSCLASPQNVGYKVEIIDNVSSDELLGPGYGMIQPCGNTWNLDTYTPNLPALALITSGSPGAPGAPGPIGPAGPVSAGSSPSCPLQSATQFCLTSPPFLASASGTTTTTGTFIAGATSGTVGSCSTFIAGNGVLIAGAGSGGANYIGTVSSCSGAVMAVSPALAGSANNATVQHDETTAFNQAVQFLSPTGGTIFLPDGLYLVNGPLQDTGGANAVIPMPSAQAYGAQSSLEIRIRGVSPPAIDGTSSGTIIETSVNTGHLFGGYYSGNEIYPHFTNYWLDLENLDLRSTSQNPGIVMVDASNLMALHANHLWCDANTTTNIPTNTAGACLIFPGLTNNVSNLGDDLTCTNFYTCFLLTEHTRIGSMYAATSYHPFLFDIGANSAAPSTYVGNAIQVAYAWSLLSHDCMASGSHKTVVSITLNDCELPTTYSVDDGANLLYGRAGLQNPYQPQTLTNNGATHLTVENLSLGTCAGPLCTSAGAGGSTVSAKYPSTGLIEYWANQQVAGAVSTNGGRDFTNSLSASTVTFASAQGFTNPVATFNGTSSVMTANSASGTAFDGGSPFTACAWVNLSSYSNQYDNWIMDNLNHASSDGGWGLEVYGPGLPDVGNLNFYLASAIPSGAIQVYTYGNASNPISLGTTSHVCVAYDGSRSAAGVYIFVNGVAQLLRAKTNNLGSTSSASTLPLSVGSYPGLSLFSAGAIGSVSIWNRQLVTSDVQAVYAAGPTPN